ncbi:MAG: response regulator [Luteimonas sp.]
MSDAAPLRVLIVDDSRDDAELTELALRDAGIAVEVRRACGEADLTGLLRDFHPQLVLSDVNLPGFSGVEAMRLTRALLPGVPVVFLTGSSIGAPGEELPVGDALVFKDELELLPDVVRRLMAA